MPFEGHGFLDIDWKSYCFQSHMKAATIARPLITVARDVECLTQLDGILREAEELQNHSRYVIIVPKDIRLSNILEAEIPSNYILGYSVPTKYGGTAIPAQAFTRATHLLGGRPDVQRKLADLIPVVSFDCNRFTLDARYGDFFNGTAFRPHPVGGYEACLRDSIANIDTLWSTYVPPKWAA